MATPSPSKLPTPAVDADVFQRWQAIDMQVPPPPPTPPLRPDAEFDREAAAQLLLELERTLREGLPDVVRRASCCAADDAGCCEAGEAHVVIARHTKTPPPPTSMREVD